VSKTFRAVIAVSGLLVVVPMLLYFLVFHGALSSNDQNWAAFGLYFGGVVGTVFGYGSFLIVLFTYGRSEVDRTNDRREMFFFKYLEIHRENLATISHGNRGAIIEGPKVLLSFNSAVALISTDFENYKSRTENQIDLGNRALDYSAYRRNCEDFIFVLSAIRSVIDLDLIIVDYILDNMPKATVEKYLSVQFSQIGKDELFALTTGHAKRIEDNAKYQSTIRSKCDASQEYESMIRMGKNAFEYLAGYRTMATWK
jgi:hypothetical protein